MGKNPTHLWLLKLENTARKHLRALTRDQRQSIFLTMRQLLEAENPYAIPEVKKLSGDFAPLRRIPVGEHRILFYLVSELTIHQKHTYKGLLIVVSIIARKDAY